MAEKTFSAKAIEIAGRNPNNFSKRTAKKIQDLLKPINGEISISTVKWQPCKGNW